MSALRLVLAVAAVAIAGVRADSNVCSTVTCIANGESECDRSSESCPPCMYLLSTGSYSCYDLEDGACPYDDVYTICDSSSSASGSSASGSSSATTTAPTATTAAPTTSTSNSTTAPAAAASSASSSGSDESSSGAGTVSPTTVESSAPSGTSTSASTSSSSSSNLRSSSTGSTSQPDTSASTTSSSSGSSSSSASTISTGSSTNSSNVVMTAVLVGCTLVGAVILAVFIAHRVRRRRLERDQNRSTFGHDGDMFVVPRSTKRPSMFFASRMYNSHETPTTSTGNRTLDSIDNGSFVMLAASQTRLTPTITTNTTTSGITLHSMVSLSSSTATFAVGPQFRPEDSTIVDFSASNVSNVSTASTKTHPPSPMTPAETQVTRIPHGAVPGAIVEDEEEEMSSFEQQSRYVRLASAESVIYAKKDKFAPDSSGVSISSSMSSLSDEYDIVDPGTIREGERRNTEVLVRDSEFPKFSSFSETDMLSEDGDDEDRQVVRLAKEHEI